MSAVSAAWAGFGKPGMWILVMAALTVEQLYNGASLIGSVWVIVSLFAFFLSRIASAVEKIADEYK